MVEGNNVSKDSIYVYNQTGLDMKLAKIIMLEIICTIFERIPNTVPFWAWLYLKLQTLKVQWVYLLKLLGEIWVYWTLLKQVGSVAEPGW